MPSGFDIQATGYEEVHGLLNRLVAISDDWTPAWPDVRDEIWQIEKERFDSGGKGEWAPLSPGYAAWKEKNYPGQPLLVREDILRSSLTGDDYFSVVEMEPMGLTVGTNVPYAAAHQYGGGRLPARPVMDLDDSDVGRVAQIMRQYLDRAVRDNS